MNELLFSFIVIAVSAFALWHGSTAGWLIAAAANAAAAWMWWGGL